MDVVSMYLSGNSLPQISGASGIPISTVRGWLLAAGVSLRSRTEGVRLASSRLSKIRSRPRCPLSDAHKANIAKAHAARAEIKAKGTRITSNGYVEYTRGPHKGRKVHDVMMEAKLGRRLRPGEEIHHVDENRQHNDLGNFELLTKPVHARLHRLLEVARGIERKRLNGRFA